MRWMTFPSISIPIQAMADGIFFFVRNTKVICQDLSSKICKRGGDQMRQLQSSENSIDVTTKIDIEEIK